MPINQVELATATQEDGFSLNKLTFLQCLLPCAEHSLSAEYSAVFSCRIFVFNRNKKIRFRSITKKHPTLLLRNFITHFITHVITRRRWRHHAYQQPPDNRHNRRARAAASPAAATSQRQRQEPDRGRPDQGSHPLYRLSQVPAVLAVRGHNEDREGIHQICLTLLRGNCLRADYTCVKIAFLTHALAKLFQF
jgi:hypothetical protein